MSLIQQVTQLLSASPGNVFYHLATLFALQAIFAMSLSQRRRDRSDQRARRMAWAAAAIFLFRLLILIVSILHQENGNVAAALLAPLEQAIQTLTAVLVVWALAPHTVRFPRLGDALMGLAVLVIAVMYLFFAQTQPGNGLLVNAAAQTTAWAIFQIGVLASGALLSLAHPRLRLSLHPVVITLLLAAHVVQLLNPLDLPDPGAGIALWLRLGYLVVFPLWAVLTYRRSLSRLLAAHLANRPPVEQLVNSLQLATNTLAAITNNTIAQHAAEMAARLMDASFAGIALLDEANDNRLHLKGSKSLPNDDRLPLREFDLLDWPAFRQAVEQLQTVELLPNGLGARQLHHWAEVTDLGRTGAMLIQPLISNDKAIGLLLLARPEEQTWWSERDRSVAPALAAYLAQLLTSSQARQAETANQAAEGVEAVSGRIIALEEERNQLQAALETITSRLKEAEGRATSASKQARELEEMLQEMKALGRDERIAALEKEIEALRESLLDAEEAMALAAADETELSREWVMLTITRYSGQLEEAQVRIHDLEAQLAQRDRGPASETAASLIQELRTPMTSIAGYTDLLLSEKAGMLGATQREFLQRVKANTEQMWALLDQIMQLTTTTVQAPLEEESVDVQRIVETAVNAVITKVREKNLLIELDIADDLPELAIGRDALWQIMTSLLGNACQSSASNGAVAVTARANTVTGKGSNGHTEKISYLQLEVTDNGGGISADDRPHVFDPHLQADDPLIAGLGDKAAGLSVARALAEANGGRIWVESEMGVGSTFSALFPVAVTKPSSANSANQGKRTGNGG